MNESNLKTIEQIEMFLEGIQNVEFQVKSKDEKYEWLQATLIRFEYLTLKKKSKGRVFRYYLKILELNKIEDKDRPLIFAVIQGNNLIV